MKKSRVVERLIGRTINQVGTNSTAETVSSSLVDRVVELTSELIGDDLDERVERIFSDTHRASLLPFGVDADSIRLTLSLIAYLHRYYFRTQVYGLEDLPAGRMILVGNHAGQIPIDGILIAASLALDADPPRFARNTVDRFVSRLPFISVWFSRVGQILGAPENARILLEQDNVLVSFPEGVAGILKTFDKRYQLQSFGSGFMRLALQTHSPIVPVAVIGSEEQLVSLSDLKPLARLFGLPAIPVIPQFLFGFLFPLPTKYRIYFGKPMHFTGDSDGDDEVTSKKVWEVRTEIQRMVNHGIKERDSVFW